MNTLQPVAPAPEWLADAEAPILLTLAPRPQARPAGTLRRFVQAFAVFLCGFLVVRTIGLEPFGVPTGSMAPTLIGNHRELACSRCGAAVLVGEPGPDARPVRWERCRCPNCDQVLDLSAAQVVAGDRLLVDKSVYLARPPRRWEVAVFRCPADADKPYVKRVAGLPGEFIQISGGDLYADGTLQRKTLAQVRETRLLAFDLAHAPPGGWGERWLAESSAAPMPHAADDTVLRDSALLLDASASPGATLGLTYRHMQLDTHEELPVGDRLGYNGPPEQKREFARRGGDLGDPVHDFSVTCTLEVRAGSGRVAFRLSDGADDVRAEFPVGAADDLPGAQLQSGTAVAPGVGPRLEAGKSYRIEFSFVDRRASLALDGREVVPCFDLPADLPGRPRRRGMARPFQAGVRGVSVALRDFKLYHDIHYLGVGKPETGWRLGAGEYFLLGDNSANSHDSRVWTVNDRPAPGVPEGEFVGKPFLIHQPLRVARVALPGRERTFQTPDWGRIRWLR